MRYLLSGVAIAVAVAVAGAGSVGAQTYPDPNSYRFNAPTPEDAYRQGLINRWELERLIGPRPQALQGPSVDGSKGFDPGR